MNAESILLRLVEARSDTGTGMELAAAHALCDIIREDGYFKLHPDRWGAWDIGDHLGRPVVWALKKGSGRRTLVLSGHYDAVGVDNYGTLAHLACQPQALKLAMLAGDDLDDEVRRDLESEDWLFGRATNDMKAGLAVNLTTLLEYIPREVNVLFTAVPDEENLSAGARAACKLYTELKNQFGLAYTLGVVSEPSFRNVDIDPRHIVINGSAGKIMPMVVVHGLGAHAARSMTGINAAALAAEILGRIELNTDLVSVDKGCNTQPPAAQMLRDMKTRYDVTLPDYAAVAFNLTFLGGDDPIALLERVRLLCLQGLGASVKKYDAVYDYLEEKGMMDPVSRKRFIPRAMTVAQLEAEAGARQDFCGFRTALRSQLSQAVDRGDATLQSATMQYLQSVMVFAGVPPATAVVGIAPPYYPAVNNDYLPGDISVIIDRLIDALAGDGIPMRKAAYGQGISDLSYMSCANAGAERGVMDNIPLRGAMYDTDFEAIAQVSIPTVMIGPGSKLLHQKFERVYLPDVRDNLPQIFRRLIGVLESDI